MLRLRARFRYPIKLVRSAVVRLFPAIIAVALDWSAPAAAAEISRTDLGISSLTDTVAFLYKGPVAQGDLLNLQSQISALPPNTPVAIVLESPGGSLGEGIALAILGAGVQAGREGRQLHHLG